MISLPAFVSLSGFSLRPSFSGGAYSDLQIVSYDSQVMLWNVYPSEFLQKKTTRSKPKKALRFAGSTRTNLLKLLNGSFLIFLSPSVLQTGRPVLLKKKSSLPVSHQFGSAFANMFDLWSLIIFAFVFCSHTNKFIFLKNDFSLRLFGDVCRGELGEPTYFVSLTGGELRFKRGLEKLEKRWRQQAHCFSCWPESVERNRFVWLCVELTAYVYYTGASLI